MFRILIEQRKRITHKLRIHYKREGKRKMKFRNAPLLLNFMNETLTDHKIE